MNYPALNQRGSSFLAGEILMTGKGIFSFIIKYSLFLITAISFLPFPIWAAEHRAVSGTIANIRSGPGTNHEVYYQAEKYYPLEIVRKSGNWYEVKDYEGDIGWIHKSLLGNIDSIITVKPKCNIRAGAGMKYDILFVAKEGVPFKVLKRKGNWINIRHAEGHEGWIHRSLVW